MFNITICYNDNYLENINDQIKSILNKRSLSEKFKINIVRSSIDLLKSFSEEDECNILFLEEELIDLKGVSIIDLIRKSLDNKAIITAVLNPKINTPFLLSVKKFATSCLEKDPTFLNTEIAT